MWISQSLWHSITHVDRTKVNTWIAFRNALAIAIPLGIGITLHNPLGAVAVATGALNVAYSDGNDPYPQRARRMIAWTLLGGLAVFIGSVTGSQSWLAILVAAAWAFIAGLAVSVSIRAGDLGLNTLVAVIVFAARGAMSAKGAAEAGLLVIAGGSIQMTLALLLWPLRRYQPERAAVGTVYSQLAKELSPQNPDPLVTPLSSPSPQVQDVLASLGTDHGVEGVRLLMLLNQADRLRMSTYVLERLLPELQHEDRKKLEPAKELASLLEQVLQVSSTLVGAFGERLTGNSKAIEEGASLKELQRLAEQSHRSDGDETFPLGREVSSAVDVLAGQLRVVAALASHATTDGATEFARQEESHPWRLQVRSWIGTMRANLDFRSTYFRHAVRMAACVAAGDIISRYIEWQRTYWLPMTIAVVLKPDFTTTISRGILRMVGTLMGLFLATVLYHAFPETAITQLLLVGVFAFMLRSLGPANYGVFSIAISGLIVFLIAETGVSPKEVVIERALNTGAGGLFAVVAYSLWPTWERTQVPDAMAEMLDAARNYFQAIVTRFGHGQLSETSLDEFRAAFRRSRSNVEASVDRTAAEPRVETTKLSCLRSMLASSHALVHSIMGLEAFLVQGQTRTPAESFQQFANDVEFTLYFLSAALRGSYGAFETLPKLREDHRRMVEARGGFEATDEMLLIDTDQLTVALNTLREQVTQYVGG